MTIVKQSRLVSITKSDLNSIETLENEYVMVQLERKRAENTDGKNHER
ncbi:MAG: hypothetical protein M1460_04015 [Candidatus Thermoplasmatota archaeon]|nr:hypothetical protein [Candidatus Thermoplasmatota archaeon]